MKYACGGYTASKPSLRMGEAGTERVLTQEQLRPFLAVMERQIDMLMDSGNAPAYVGVKPIGVYSGFPT